MLKHLLPITAIVVILVLLVIRSFEDDSHPESYTIPDFPLIAQPDNITCGPTCVSMVLKKYGIDATIREISDVAHTEIFEWKGEPIGGTAPEYLKIALDQWGVPCTYRACSLDMLKHYVSQDRPCIALVRSWELGWHFVVVVGYDSEYIEIADPGNGQRYKLTESVFMGCWKFETDMSGKWMDTPKGDILLMLVKSIHSRPQTLVVPDIHIPD